MCSYARQVRLALLGLLLTMGWNPATAQNVTSLSPPPGVRQDAAYGRIGDWFALRDLDKHTLSRSNLNGKVLFVNFWATWCGPCVEEIPAIVDLADAFRDGDVAFLLISIDENERDVRRFVKEHELPLPIYFRDWQPGESTFTAGIVPATFIVSKQGEIVYQHHGAADWNTESVRRLLGELRGGKELTELPKTTDYP